MTGVVRSMFWPAAVGIGKGMDMDIDDDALSVESALVARRCSNRVCNCAALAWTTSLCKPIGL